MFKQFKSMFFWSLIYKFRKRLTLVIMLLFVVLFSQWIYSDIVEYLTLTNKTNYLDIALPVKWLVIFFNIGLSSYLILSLFKVNQKEKNKDIKTRIKKDKLTDREKEFMKRDIRTEAQIIIDKNNQ